MLYVCIYFKCYYVTFVVNCVRKNVNKYGMVLVPVLTSYASVRARAKCGVPQLKVSELRI